jgi:1,4-dihydroxy-2-naphthoate octaprenyltransferase
MTRFDLAEESHQVVSVFLYIFTVVTLIAGCQDTLLCSTLVCMLFARVFRHIQNKKVYRAENIRTAMVFL